MYFIGALDTETWCQMFPPDVNILAAKWGYWYLNVPQPTLRFSNRKLENRLGLKYSDKGHVG